MEDNFGVNESMLTCDQQAYTKIFTSIVFDHLEHTHLNPNSWTWVDNPHDSQSLQGWNNCQCNPTAKVIKRVGTWKWCPQHGHVVTLHLIMYVHHLTHTSLTKKKNLWFPIAQRMNQLPIQFNPTTKVVELGVESWNLNLPTKWPHTLHLLMHVHHLKWTSGMTIIVIHNCYNDETNRPLQTNNQKIIYIVETWNLESPTTWPHTNTLHLLIYVYRLRHTSLMKKPYDSQGWNDAVPIQRPKLVKESELGSSDNRATYNTLQLLIYVHLVRYTSSSAPHNRRGNLSHGLVEVIAARVGR